MKHKIATMLQIKDKKSVFVTESGEEIKPNTYLAKKFNLKEGDSILVLMIADNGKEEMPFDIEKAKLFTSRKLTGIQFAISNGRPVKIYTASAKGDYPVVGLDPDGMPCCWNAEGKAQNGDEELTLVMIEI